MSNREHIFYCGVFCWLALQVHKSSRLRVWMGTRLSFVCLSRGGDGSSIGPRLHSRRFRIRSLWTASVEPADMHYTASLTARALYSGGSGLLRDSDLWWSRRSRLVYLFTLRLFSIETPRLYVGEALLGCPRP